MWEIGAWEKRMLGTVPGKTKEPSSTPTAKFEFPAKSKFPKCAKWTIQPTTNAVSTTSDCPVRNTARRCHGPKSFLSSSIPKSAYAKSNDEPICECSSISTGIRTAGTDAKPSLNNDSRCSSSCISGGSEVAIRTSHTDGDMW